jgi:hypothetical protein
MSNGVSVMGLTSTFIGALFIWSGVKGTSLTSSLRALLSGAKPPTAQTNPIGTPATTTGTAPTAGVSIATNIPAAKGAYTQAQLQTLWTNNGGSSSTAANAACHAMQESSGIANATSANPDGGTNVGLFQLDTKGVGAGYSVAELSDPNLNTQVTIMATKGGVDWSEWATPGC